MMKNKFLFSLLAVCSVSLCSCGTGVHHETQEYFAKELAWKEGFKILQLGDIHLGVKDDLEKHFAFLDLTIKDANADLIIVCGDLFTFAEVRTMQTFFDFLDSYKTPWTVTFGNHDEQCNFSLVSMTTYLNNYGSYCCFKDIQDDDVYGNANFAINLKEGSNVKYQVYVFDSNRYNYGQGFGYDNIHQDQIDWYRRMVEYSYTTYGAKIPSVNFFHIPCQEYQTAYDIWKANGEQDTEDVKYYSGECREPVSCSKIPDDLFETMVALKSENKGDSVGIFTNHDHINNLDIKYKGIRLIYGIHSTDRVYHDDDLLGGLLITLRSTPDAKGDLFTTQPILHSYEEIK